VSLRGRIKELESAYSMISVGKVDAKFSLFRIYFFIAEFVHTLPQGADSVSRCGTQSAQLKAGGKSVSAGKIARDAFMSGTMRMAGLNFTTSKANILEISPPDTGERTKDAEPSRTTPK
jgi:hypothetical protein